jgi:predicted kinase
MKPTAFFVIGPAGSGKSTVSKRIARRYGAAYLDKDTIATAFTEFILQANGFDRNERDNNALYQSTILPIEYDTLLRTCGDNLAIGTSVVLDAPFGRFFADRDYLVKAKRQHAWPDAELIVVHVKADGQTVLDRLLKRDNSRDGWKIEHWHQFWTDTQTADCCWRSAHHIVFENNAPEVDLAAFDRAVAEVAGITPALVR